MITAKEFTKAEDGVMPAEPGLFICVLRSASGEAFFSQATFSYKSKMFLFDLFDQKIRHHTSYEIIGWMQVEEPVIIAKQLIQR